MVAEVVRTKGAHLGHELEQQKLPDREIEELETSLHEVNSHLKQASLRTEKKHRMDRLDKLRPERFVAEQQLRKTEEEEASEVKVLIVSSAKYADKSNIISRY